jgi:NADP-dependent 3-hydroxy acid dehydrogenase YdfG
VLNVGTRAGVYAGDKLQVTRTGREIKDPATGKVLRRTETELGIVTITQADEVSSEGTYEGQPGVKVGDHVKK